MNERQHFGHATPTPGAASDAVQTLPCGHPAALLLKSAETGEPLYCELCDDKHGRQDAEARESELLQENADLRAALATTPAPASDAVPDQKSTTTDDSKIHYWRNWFATALRKIKYEAASLADAQVIALEALQQFDNRSDR